MDAVLLDTDVFSYLLRGGEFADLYRPKVEGRTIALTFVSVGELYFLTSKRKWGLERIAALEERFKAAVIIPYDVEIARTYGRLKANLKTPQGSDRTIFCNDLWIAACAVRHSLPLISNNRKHFEGIPGLELITAENTEAQKGPLFGKPPSDPSV